MALWIVGLLLLLMVFRKLWKAYTHPASVLGRQAANMNWLADGFFIDEDGYKTVLLKRDGKEAFISFKERKVCLLKPRKLEPFDDFIALERWLTLEKEDLTPNPKHLDPIWGKLNNSQMDAVQKGFMDVCSREQIEQYFSTDDLPLQVLKSISLVANKVANDNQISPAYIPLVIHQYVDSDHMQRVMFKDKWVSYMATRPDLARQPESYMEYINATYFRKR